MKITLINPANNMVTSRGLLENIAASLSIYPPLGLLYLASYMARYGSHEVNLIDCQREPGGIDSIEKYLRDTSPRIVGIYAVTFNLANVLAIAKIVKAVDEKITVCIGGPHCSVYPFQTIEFAEVDFVVRGDGEITLAELVDTIEHDGDFSAVKGILYKNEGKIVETPLRPFLDNLDVLPFPARHLVDKYSYRTLLGRNVPYTVMITSRGCPYQCIFCSRQHQGYKIRSRSPENIVSEISECVANGIQEIFFYDDLFNFDEQRVYEICDRIIAARLDFKWNIRARVDLMNRKMLERLNAAGCTRIQYGIEAGTDRMLKVLKKGITVEQARRVVADTKEAGIQMLLYFLIGAPTETKEDIMNTIRFAIELDPNYAMFAIVAPFPGTELYTRGLEQGIYGDCWKTYAQHPTAGFKLPFWTGDLSEQELNGLLKYAYKSFYFRPLYIMRHLGDAFSLKSMVQKASFALDIWKHVTCKN
ncbi:MAG: radical SAM protein [Candidatus Omnitrophica bacterium]|nr:radical SAM protein [Candidatus Omnitrophota bacterium]